MGNTMSCVCQNKNIDQCQLSLKNEINLCKYEIKQQKIGLQIHQKITATCFSSNNCVFVYGQCQLQFTIFINSLRKYCRKIRMLNSESIIHMIIASKFRNIFFFSTFLGQLGCWNLNDKYNQYCQDDRTIMQILLSEDEKQFISCHSNKKIRIWMVNLEQCELIFDYQLQEIHQGMILFITMNKNMDTLISGSEGQLIVIWKKDHTLKWKFKQQIKLDQSVSVIRGSFISNNIIVIDYFRNSLVSYKENNDKYEIYNILKLPNITEDDYFFPSFYCSKKNLFICKHGNHLYLFTIQNGEELIEVNKIECSSYESSVSQTINGDYIIISQFHRNQQITQLEIFRIFLIQNL